MSRNQFFTAEYKRVVTPALLNTIRFSHSRLRFEGLPAFPSVPTLAFIAGQNEMGVIAIGGGVTSLGGTAQNPNTANSFYWTASNDLSFAKGRHLLKTGALIEELERGSDAAREVGRALRIHTMSGLARLGFATRDSRPPQPGSKQVTSLRPNTLFGFYVKTTFAPPIA